MDWRSYRKKPVVPGGSVLARVANPAVRAYRTAEPLLIETYDGPVKANPGDWIIRDDTDGELYTWEPAMFDGIYEEAPASEDKADVR